MHPVIRVVCFLLFSIALARPNTEQLAFALVLIISLLFILPAEGMRQAFSMVKRLRWLLLSVLVIYGWFTPGPSFNLPLPDYLQPSRPGIEAGLLRILTLVLILLAVGGLLVTTGRQQLIAALYWLLSPFRLLNRQPERFAVRLALTLEYVERQQQIWHTPVQINNGKDTGRIQKIIQYLQALLPTLLQQAEQQHTTEVVIDVLPQPPLIQWSYPLLLVAGFVLSGMIDL